VSDPTSLNTLEGKRKYRAFLFSLAALSLLTAAGFLNGGEYSEALKWILGIFGLTNVGERAANAYTVTRES